MDRADLYRVYELGAAIHPLSDVNDATSLGEYFGAYDWRRTGVGHFAWQ
jgi:hypothetical protein